MRGLDAGRLHQKLDQLRSLVALLVALEAAQLGGLASGADASAAVVRVNDILEQLRYVLSMLIFATMAAGRRKIILADSRRGVLSGT